MKKIVLLLSVFLIVISCAKDESKNVNQDSIFVIYELFYNDSDDITTARATFRFGGAGGTLLELSDPASVTFQGEELLYNSVTGVHRKEFSGFITTGTFVYTDLDDNVFTNSIPTIYPIHFPDVDTISSVSSFVFEWVGEPVDDDETITLTINGTMQANIESFFTSTEGETQLVLAADKLGNLGVGNASCTLQRLLSDLSVNEGTSEGGRMAVWYTSEDEIYISD